MAKYFLSNQAVEDISDIWNYTCDTWSEIQADKYYQLIITSCQAVAARPAIGRRYDEISSEMLGFHVGKHIIFYKLIDQQEIEVIRILHERMDLKNKLTEQ
ncbi:MAG: type II toxin-antitoxin system RelE/ParE family toxin [Tannerella sp.]|jgi:toxin ParE1/3/4|nr:type II toxin-antitoxin system RelE/ParE family toxin [Tannerella sp.]